MVHTALAAPSSRLSAGLSCTLTTDAHYRQYIHHATRRTESLTAGLSHSHTALRPIFFVADTVHGSGAGRERWRLSVTAGFGGPEILAFPCAQESDDDDSCGNADDGFLRELVNVEAVLVPAVLGIA